MKNDCGIYSLARLGNFLFICPYVKPLWCETEKRMEMDNVVDVDSSMSNSRTTKKV